MTWAKKVAETVTVMILEYFIPGYDWRAAVAGSHPNDTVLAETLNYYES